MASQLSPRPEQLREWLRAHDITLAALGKALGVSETRARELIVADTIPTWLHTRASALGVPTDLLPQALEGSCERPLLGTLRTPLCIVQLRHDVCCHPWNSLYLLRRWGGGEAELHLLRTGSPHGGHLPTTHRECRERVAELAVDFARRCLAPAADEPAGTPGDCAAGN